jgi:hypothetical protein
MCQSWKIMIIHHKTRGKTWNQLWIRIINWARWSLDRLWKFEEVVDQTTRRHNQPKKDNQLIYFDHIKITNRNNAT